MRTSPRYREDLSGAEFVRVRYRPADEDARTTDTARLAADPVTLGEGESYAQLAHELHDSRQLQRTVTVIRRIFKDVVRLTVCRPPSAAWISGRSRPAKPNELKEVTAKALELF